MDSEYWKEIPWPLTTGILKHSPNQAMLSSIQKEWALDIRNDNS